MELLTPVPQSVLVAAGRRAETTIFSAPFSEMENGEPMWPVISSSVPRGERDRR